MRAWLLLAALSTSAQAAQGWVKQASSLLLYDSSGTLVSEVGLARSEDSGAETETLGGVSKDGRFAWTLDKKTSWNLSRTKLLETRTSFRFLGSEAIELWKSSKVDVPDDGDPVALSDDGEMLAVARRGLNGWTAALKTWMGNTLLEAGPFPALKSVEITPNGKYMRVRWGEVDKSSTNTFIEAATKKRKDIPSEEFPLGQGRVDGDGKVYSKTKLLFDFAQDKP